MMLMQVSLLEHIRALPRERTHFDCRKRRGEIWLNAGQFVRLVFSAALSGSKEIKSEEKRRNEE